ncbi:MAG TPA: NUDIX hydrolase [Azoarcus sp.]|nr:NUDIX hydrolase [Azoarcus sp.]
MSRVWRPNVTVAAVVERNGRFLIVEEEVSEGLRLNQPAGHLEPGESLIDAVRRETLEETAYLFEPVALVGIYQWRRPKDDVTYLRFTFSGHILGEGPVAGAQLDSGIVRALWLSADELGESVARHRSPLIMRSLQDWQAGKRFGLDVFADGN